MVVIQVRIFLCLVNGIFTRRHAVTCSWHRAQNFLKIDYSNLWMPWTSFVAHSHVSNSIFVPVFKVSAFGSLFHVITWFPFLFHHIPTKTEIKFRRDEQASAVFENSSQNPGVLKPQARSTELSQSETSILPCSSNQDQVPKLGENALCFSQLAFSNFAFYVIKSFKIKKLLYSCFGNYVLRDPREHADILLHFFGGINIFFRFSYSEASSLWRRIRTGKLCHWRQVSDGFQQFLGKCTF